MQFSILENLNNKPTQARRVFFLAPSSLYELSLAALQILRVLHLRLPAVLARKLAEHNVKDQQAVMVYDDGYEHSNPELPSAQMLRW